MEGGLTAKLCCKTPDCPNPVEFQVSPTEWMCHDCTEDMVVRIAREASANHPEDRVLARLLAGYDYRVFLEKRGKPS